jgi:2-methylisocitrate lyase-like PEP mutase family enzyme
MRYLSVCALKEELQEWGYAIVIYPNSLTRTFAKAGMHMLSELQGQGSTLHLVEDHMADFKVLNKMLGVDEFTRLEARFCPPKEDN